jgi:hypothetical protein
MKSKCTVKFDGKVLKKFTGLSKGVIIESEEPKLDNQY